jgi:predicted NACHT family NTPase
MDRGIQATAAGLAKAKNALKLKGWSQQILADFAGCTRQTVLRFLGGNRIEKRISQDICNALDLNWGEIVQIEANEPDRSPNIDEIVEAVRINIYDSIQTKCGSMRVLDMTQPIDLNAIYTNVNILEKITGRQRLDLQELLQICSLESFERFSLSSVKEKKIPALDAVDKYAKLMILGKPGAGKTTFLKYVALQCIDGNFKSHLIPIFITLKDFAETDIQSSLFDYIIQLFKSYGIEPKNKIKKGLLDYVLYAGATPVEFLLRQGRLVILLDGLDEVREVDSRRVLQQIQGFSDRFPKNLFAITCRIAAKEYTFEKFTEVEVSDFDDRQIEAFTQQWFKAKNDSVKAKSLIEKLNQEPGIRELASSPLLLTLLCLVFGESGSFPSNRSELYKEGLDVLLKKWDAKRNIDRDRVYKQLSLKRKEDLLSRIALDTFDKGKYFFKQKEVERYITQYIRNLPDANIEADALQFDSEAVLKSIEAQHGLFVERARGIYSFSHLTFHEYFTARKIVTSTNSDFWVKKVATYATNKRWREVVLLTVGMLENADLFLEAMKKNIDKILSQDEQIQTFLVSIERKSYATKGKYKPASVRVYNFNIESCRTLRNAVEMAKERDRYFDIVCSQDRDLQRPFDLSRSQDRDLLLARTQSLDSALKKAISFVKVVDLDLDLTLALAIDNNIDSIGLQRSLQQMKNQLPDIKENWIFYEWWKMHGKAWTAQLVEIAIEHHNFGNDWKFTETQKKLLQQYYDANQLLVECLDSDCYVSREVREEIESTLFLPIASIEKIRSK